MGRKAVGGFGCREFYVAQIAGSLAREIIRARHYSRRVVNNSYIHLGVYLAGRLVGVLQFGYMLNPRRASKVVAGTEVAEYLELNRMWLDDAAPRNSESRALSYAVKYIRRACPRVKWIQSYADERCGGLGVTYQAAGFEYLGCHDTTFYELDGETYHVMLLTAHKKGGRRGEHLRANLGRAEKVTLRQFRYIRFLKPRCRKFLNLRPQPFPKPENLHAARHEGRPTHPVGSEPGSIPGGRSKSRSKPVLRGRQAMQF